MAKPILRLALPTPLRRLFDYLPPESVDNQKLIKHVRVRVPFQKRELIGILIDVVEHSSVPSHKLKCALEVLDEEPIVPLDVYELCTWAAQYYQHPLGEVLASALPAYVRKGKDIVGVKKTNKLLQVSAVQEEKMVLNQAQQQAITTILATKNQFNVFLLDGVTGSGKTEIYLQTIAEILAMDKQVLVMVPEISLTPQTEARFRSRFPVPIVTLHSQLSEKERFHAWLLAKEGSAKIIIGTRSAIFTPFEALGLIIIDEEHDHSFKQQEGFRYHARDLAIVRARMKQIPIVLGSATPSLESLLNVKKERYTHLCLPERAGSAQLPQYQLIDLRQDIPQQGLSKALTQTMREHLQQNNQVMLFLNRRGFAPVLFCSQCTFIIDCSRCDAHMVYHRGSASLQCHHCDSRKAVPLQCEKCGERALKPIGVGTERLEELLKQEFNDVPIIRIDRDNTKKKGAMNELLTEITNQQKAILIGTQMLAKGHHFPYVTLVAIIDADNGFFSVDFRAAEQMGQLLLQVAGRAGRAEKRGTVFIQTHQPQHSLLQTLLYSGYGKFSDVLLAERKEAELPPYTYFAVFRAHAYDNEKARRFLEHIKNVHAGFTDITLLGPAPALLKKRKGLYGQHLLVQAKQRNNLHAFLQTVLQYLETCKEAHAVKWVLDVDPVQV